MAIKNNVKPDTVLKTFWKNNQRFADLFNTVLFDGNTILKPNDLKEADTDVSSIIKFNNHADTVQRILDVVRKTAYGVDFIIWSLENQEKIHYAMPLRHMIADSLIYLKEYNEITAKNRNEKNFDTSDEFLSGLQKSDRLHPVISLCIYYGKEDWDGPFNLVDMLIMPEYLKPLVSDYKMNLIQVRKSEDFRFENQDINNLFELIRSIYNKDYDTFQRMYKNKELSTELGLTLGSVVNSQSIIKQVLAITEKGSDPNMTDPFDEMLEEMKRKEGEKARLKGRLEGRREGKLEGKLEGKIEGTINICKKFHVNQEETLRNLIEEFALSDDKAREYMNMYW
nr:Rpn family recombination-promoting nuclease/putative transposase [uncultured Anaerobutyricum sp.]